MERIKTFRRGSSIRKISEYLPVIVFLLIAIIFFVVNAFPALYGDEYDSLFDSHNLVGNIHAIGYFAQLNIWSSIFHSDIWLRILSILWFAAGLYWLNVWLKSETIPNRVRNLIVWLALLNPFLWLYGFQICFYAMFFATSILFVGRFRAWQKLSSRSNNFFLLISALLLLTAHLFGILVLGTVLLNYLLTRFGKKRWIFAILMMLIILLVFLPFTRSALVWFVYRFSNPYAAVPTGAVVRGIERGDAGKSTPGFVLFHFG